jgi:hypothetical protein
MTENVIKFRRPEEKPDPKPPRKPGLPGWVPWLGLVAVSVVIYLARQAGLLGS